MKYRFIAVNSLIAGCVVVSGVSSLLNTSAIACKGSKLLYQQDFVDPDVGWVFDSVAKLDKKERVVLKPDAGRMYETRYVGPSFSDADMCVDVTFDKGAAAKGSCAGLLFLSEAPEKKSCYTVMISPERTFGILRREESGGFKVVTKFSGSDAIKGNWGDTNKLRVLVKSPKAILYINEQKITEFDCSVPDRGGQVGFIAQSPKDGPSSFAFDNLRITSPDGAE
jgi:hypothetical protein